MKVKSVKENFIFNNLRILINFITPLITFTYSSRILGPEQIGKVDYGNSIITYFVLFATLGIPTYGIRAIAQTRDNKIQLSKIVAELSLISLISCLLNTLICIFAIFLLPTIFNDRILFLILVPNIFLTVFNYEWFYVGIEDQTYITIRYVIIKIINIIALFVVIKTSNDYLKYALLIVVFNGLSSFLNFFRLQKYVEIVSLRSLNIIGHLKPILIIFGSSLAISIYSHLDVTMIGLISGNLYVGYYAGANKIISMVLAVVTSLGSVMIPRLSNDLEKNDIKGYREHLEKSLNFILLIATPIIFGIEAVGPDLIVLFAGEKYYAAGQTIRILSPIILIIGFAHYIGLQILYTNKKEKYYTIAVTVGAISNLITNTLLIPRFNHNGAAIGSLVAETSGLLVMSILGKKLVKQYCHISWRLIGYFISSIIMFVVLKLFSLVQLNVLIYVFIGMLTYFCCFFVWLFICKIKLKDFMQKLSLDKRSYQ